MKKSIFILTAVLFSTVTMLVSCKPSTEEEKAAQENVQKQKYEVELAKDELSEAKKQANQEEWQSFKNDMDAVIDKNDAQIAELKQDMKNSGESANAEYNRRIEVLKEKNEALKVKMTTYKNDANSDWKSFKSEFNHDMNELGQAFKNLTVDNKKQ